MFYIPLIFSLLEFIFSYIMCRSSPKSTYNDDLPKIFLVRSRLLKKYFLNPKNEITIHLVISHFLGIIVFVFNIVLYTLYFLNGCTAFILNSETYLIILCGIILGVNLIIYVFDALIYIKVFKNDKY